MNWNDSTVQVQNCANIGINVKTHLKVLKRHNLFGSAAESQQCKLCLLDIDILHLESANDVDTCLHTSSHKVVPPASASALHSSATTIHFPSLSQSSTKVHCFLWQKSTERTISGRKKNHSRSMHTIIEHRNTHICPHRIGLQEHGLAFIHMK